MSEYNCEQDVYVNGTPLGVFHFSKEEAEIITQFIQSSTKCPCDWHYVGGRVVIKFIPKIVISKAKISNTLHLTSSKSMFSGIIDMKRLYENMFLILRANLLQMGGFNTDFKITETTTSMISDFTIHTL